ncbi:MAG: VWA domain-containing protein [Candidatus Omnitrophica bacterium]|nr:VWA domain-containing protein [Candidatus Omnitrophota bacterium]
MQFYAPEYFNFFWSVSLLAGIFWLTQADWKRRIAKIGNRDLVLSKLMPNFDPSTKLKQFFFLILAIIFATIALARPQWGEEKKKIQRKGIDLLFMLDTSLSMLAEDIKPSRLEKSKSEIRSVLRQLKGDRVGMIAFAGTSYLQSPLTLDYSAFQLFVDAIQTGYIPDPGTSLSQALMLAIKSFPPDNLKHKAVILFSDGEDLEGGVEEALKQAAASGLRIYVLGTGSEKGDPIPLKNEAKQKSGFKKDRNGQIVITKLNRPLLEQIAQKAGGLYLPATPGEQEIPVILKHMGTLDKKQFKENVITDKEDHFQLFLMLSFLMLCLEMFVRQAKKNKKNNGQSNGVIVAGLAALWILHSGFFENSKSLNNKANEEYKQKKYQSAIEKYRKAEIKTPEDPTIRYNLGSTLYQVQNYNQAAKELQHTLEHSLPDNKSLLANAQYNYGNTQYRLGNFEKAIDAYQKTLDLAPGDKDAKYNLEFLQIKKNAFDKKDQENKKQDKQQQKNQPKPNDQKDQQQNQQQQKQDQQQQKNQDQSKDQDKKDQQDQKDQQQQDQKKDQQDQKDKQDQDQKNQDQKEQGQNKDQDEKKDQDQPDKQKNPEEENKRDQEKEDEEKQPQDQDPQQNEEKKPDQEDQKDQQKPQPAQGSSQQQLQGQMSLNDALRLLEALKDSEKDLQDLRRPPIPERPRQVEKDW